MRKIIIAILAMVLAPTLSYAGSKAEVLHWWTSGGEAKALQVLKDDFAAKGGVWSDMPVAGGGGDAAMQTLKARIVANDAPAAAQIKGPTIQAYDREGVVAPYNIDAVAKAEGWDKLLSKQVASHMKCDNGKAYCAAPVNIHRIDWFWANKKVLDSNGIKMPTSWNEFNAAADKLQAKGIIPLAHGSQPWQDATVFEAVALGIGGNKFYKKAFVDADAKTLGSSTMVKIFDQMRKLKGYTDPGSPGRDWNVATGMVMEGKAAFQLMGDWAKGEFAVAGKTVGTDFVCVAAPGTSDGFTFNVDSFAFFQQSDVNKQSAQKAMAEEILGTNFQEVFNLNKGSIPARLGMARAKFDTCAHDSMNAFVSTAQSGGLVPSFAHGMAVPGAVAGAITDVATNYFNSDTSAADGKAQLVAAIQAAM